MEFHAVPGVSFANQVAEFGPENFLERQRISPDHGHRDFALTQRGSDLQPDEA